MLFGILIVGIIFILLYNIYSYICDYSVRDLKKNPRECYKQHIINLYKVDDDYNTKEFDKFINDIMNNTNDKEINDYIYKESCDRYAIAIYFIVIITIVLFFTIIQFIN